MAGILMGVKDFMGDKKFVKEEKYDMCEAIQEMMNDSWQDGIECGMERGIERGTEDTIRNIVRNMLRRGMADEDIRVLAECGQEVIDEIRKGSTDYKKEL